VTAASGADRVVGPLTAFARLPDWLATPMQPERVVESLSRHVPELAEGRLSLLDCTGQQLRVKESGWLARYELRLAPPAGRPREVVLVGVLHPPGDALPARTGAGSREATFGERGWAGVLPDLRLELRVQERDEALPALATLVRPAAVARLLEPVLQKAGYDEARITTCHPAVVRYKPGSRCTVVVGVDYAASGAGPSPVIVKTHQGDKGAIAWAAMNALWQRQETWRHAVRLAEPLAYLREDRVLVQGPVPGELTLKELIRQVVAGGDTKDLARLRSELARTAQGLAAVHATGASYARTATLQGELLEIAEVVQRLGLTVPEVALAAGPLLAALRDGAAAVPPDPAVSAHYTFRPAQVLLSGGECGFIDFDGASMAEPALDLGRFRASLRDIGVSAPGPGGEPRGPEHLHSILPVLDELCEHFLAEYQRHARVSRQRVVLWETCELLTVLLHTWTKVRLLHVQPRLALLVHHLRTHSLLPEGAD
jgi:hypothetical protein